MQSTPCGKNVAGNLFAQTRQGYSRAAEVFMWPRPQPLCEWVIVTAHLHRSVFQHLAIAWLLVWLRPAI